MSTFDTKKALIQIIANAVLDIPLPQGFLIENENDLYDLARKHDVAHLVGYSINKSIIQISSQLKRLFIQHYYQAVQRVAIIEKDINMIRTVFEESQIDFIPLKGAVIRKLYPEEWMRVSGDIDLLVSANNLKLAENILIERLDCKVTSYGVRHDHVLLPSGIHIDLHFTLTDQVCPAKIILDEVWNHCTLIEGKKHEYAMEDAYLYLFHMYHMSDHFQKGGCGIRPFIDTWILNHSIDFDSDSRQSLLKEGGLKTFADSMKSIAEEWFTADCIFEENEIVNYIFSGGVFGWNQLMAAKVAQQGGRKKYIFSRAFLPLRKMKRIYPVLNKVPIFLPFCWIHRWVKCLFNGKTKKVKYELDRAKENEQLSYKIIKMFKRLELR